MSSSRYPMLGAAVRLVVVIALSFSFCADAEEQTVPPEATMQRFYQKFGSEWFEHRLSSGDLRTLIGCPAPRIGTRADAEVLIEFVKAKLFPLGASTLTKLEPRITPAGTHYEFIQRLDGKEIAGAALAISVEPKGCVHIRSTLARSPMVIPVPTLTVAERTKAREVVSIALEGDPAAIEAAVIANDLRCGSIRTTMVVGEASFLSLNGVLHIVSKVDVRVALEQGERVNLLLWKEYAVDVSTFLIVDVRNYISEDSDATGKVFNPNPRNTLRDDSIATGNVPAKAYSTQKFMIADPVNGEFTLSGKAAVIVEEEPPDSALVPQTDAQFLFERGGSEFAAVMAYYHLTRIRDHVIAIGFPKAAPENIKVDVDGYACVINGKSAYLSESNYMRFGRFESQAWVAEDGDAVAHEAGHAIQAAQLGYGYASDTPENNAMKEGFADYWAMSSFANETRVSGHDLAVWGEWGIHRRELNSPRTLGELRNEPGVDAHVNGAVWSARLLEIFMLLGQDAAAADKLILKGHASLATMTEKPTMAEAAYAMIFADKTVAEDVCNVFAAAEIIPRADCAILARVYGTPP